MKKTIDKTNRQKFNKARKRLDEIEKKIAPFAKEREVIEDPTSGKWQTDIMQIRKNCHTIYC